MNLSVFCNLGSLLLGLIAWTLPVLALLIKSLGRHADVFMLASFTACSASLALQFMEIMNRVELSDWSALMDTLPTLLKVVVLLIIVTTGLNLALLLKRQKA